VALAGRESHAATWRRQQAAVAGRQRNGEPMSGAGFDRPGVSSYPLIDVLRGAAALSVVVYHVIEMGQWTSFPTDHGLMVFRFGWVGVNLFLVISGFVIGLTALAGFNRQGTGFRGSFARRRLARIVPLYLLTGLIYVLLVESSLLQGPASWLMAQVASHLLFVHNLSPTTFGTIDGPNWSVALEMQFYLLMLWLTPWIARLPAWRMLFGAILLAAGFRWATTLVLVPGTAEPGTQHIFSVWLPGVIDHFALGILMARATRGDAGAWLAERLRPGWAPFAWWVVLAAVLLRVAGHLLLQPGYWERTAMIVGMPLLLALGLAAAVAAAITFPYPRSALHRPLRYLGEISYGIYLWHVPVLLSVLQRKLGWQGPRLLIFVLCATLLLAAFSWHLMEKPAMERVKRSGG
jgi:peptidoglycan/LPS O-acetylase OafA/YrhL